MKILQSAFFRGIISIIIGILLIQYREETMTWLTVSIGILFFLSGIISCAIYYSERRQADGLQVFDASGTPLAPLKPTFPLVGLGSIVLGVILAVMPNTFVSGLMYILAAMLILGAVGQFVALASIRRFVSIGAFFWVMPCLILLVAIFVMVKPMASASTPLLIIGYAMAIYGVTECINALKVSKANKRRAAAEKAGGQGRIEPEASTTTEEEKTTQEEEKQEEKPCQEPAQ